jgi:hypothetical protein
VAVACQQHERIVGQAQVEQRSVGPAAAQHLGVEGAGEAHAAARPRRLAGAQVREHFVGAGQHAFDQRLHRAAGRLLAQQPRLDDAGVVEHQQVTGR